VVPDAEQAIAVKLRKIANALATPCQPRRSCLRHAEGSTEQHRAHGARLHCIASHLRILWGYAPNCGTHTPLRAVTQPNPSANGPIPEAAGHGQPTMFRDERSAPGRRRCTTLHPCKRNFRTPPPHGMPENLGQWASGAAKPLFGCGGGYSRALDWGAAPTNGAAHEPHLPVAQRSGSRETPTQNHGWSSFVDVSLSPSDPEPRFRRAEGASRSLGEPNPNSPVRNPSSPGYFKRRPRKRRTERFRVNALALQPGRSRLAACVRAFGTRGCVRGGLLWWASAVARPRHWPTVAGVLEDCLSAHQETFPRSGVSV
jgi:hypothetical protein